LEDLPLEKFLPVLQNLIENKDKNKQRAAAELLAGIIGGKVLCQDDCRRYDGFAGSKHWPTSKQQKLWIWIVPSLKKIIGQNLKTDTLSIWSSFLEVSPS
jgi:proteasome activator subunit 4